MSRDLTTPLKGRQTNLHEDKPWVWLYEFEVPTSPATRYRFAAHPTPIDFGLTSAGAAITYLPFPISHGGFRTSRDGDLPTFQVQIGNPTREVSDALEAHSGLSGQPVVVRLVNLNQLNDPNAQIRIDAQVVKAKATVERVTIELAVSSLLRIQFPKYRYVRDHCRWMFGGPECGYAIPAGATNTVGGGFDNCPRTLVACGVRGDDESARSLTVRHPERYGGWPGIS